MSNEVDWGSAPEGAEFYACKMFYKSAEGSLFFYEDGHWHQSQWSLSERMTRFDYQPRPAPQEKPAAAQAETKQPTTAAEYLSACAQVQLERGKQYDASGTGERSFDAAAEAFNCITGKHLRGSDVCLILELVKKVRQYSDTTRLHADSVLDAVSYASLWAEELTKELGK